MKTLYVVRHGQTEWNVIDRFQGRLDSPLTPAGIRHAEEHGELLARESVVHVIASPLGRTRHTAEIINDRLNAMLEFDDRLVERDCGAWEGMTSNAIQREYPDEWAARLRAPYYHRPPRGENLADMLVRVQPLLDGLHALPHERIALVSHGMMGRVIVSHLLRMAPEDAHRVAQPNDVVYRIELGRERRFHHFRNGLGPHEGFASRRPQPE